MKSNKEGSKKHLLHSTKADPCVGSRLTALESVLFTTKIQRFKENDGGVRKQKAQKHCEASRCVTPVVQAKL